MLFKIIMNQMDMVFFIGELVGHGSLVGLHESPEIPNFLKKEMGKKFVNGMVIAFE